MSYLQTYEQWQADPETFWLRAAEAIDWTRPPSRALDEGQAPFYRWFADAEANTCWNCVDRHVAAGRGEQAAILYDSPVTGSQARITYSELLERVARLAGALARAGVGRGDRVLIYMPMVPETLFAMLACARLGAVHSVVFGGFAANELAVRIDDARPKVILAASCGIEPKGVVAYKPLLDGALELARHRPDGCVLLQRPQLAAELVAGRDHEWQEFQRHAAPADCVPIGAEEPLYILYTSGTTGQPKGVVRPSGGHLVALAWSMRHIYGVEPGEVFWAASDVGWVVGHSYICYGPLLNGSTTVLFEGKPVGTPDAGTFWRVISEHQVRTMFTAPTAFRAIKRQDPHGEQFERYDLSCLRALFLAGERADTATLQWAEEHLQVPVVDHWWQTESGWPMAAIPLGVEHLPSVHGSVGVPMPGYSIHILDDAGHRLPAGKLGAIAVELPLPPGNLSTLWQADDRYRRSYLETFPGYYETGDAGFLDENGYLYVMARTDDVINVAGHRLSTGAMEEVLAGHPDVAECAVIGVADAMKGQLPVGFLCLNSDCRRPVAEIAAEAIARMRQEIGPVAAFKRVLVIDRLPKTRSGKILRGTMVKIAEGEPFKVPPTIDDPAILDEISTALANAEWVKSAGD